MSDVGGRAVPAGAAPDRPSCGSDAAASAAVQTPARLLAAFLAGAGVGVLGGMIGLGGAEFRLPLLIGVFGFAALAAVILNKALSLVVVLAALPARLIAVPFEQVAPHWAVVLNLLAGSLVGAWLGATWATRLRSAALYRILAVLLLAIAAVLLATHFATIPSPGLTGAAQIVAGVVAGIGIGVVAALMGVAGGELLIPTIVLLYGLDIRIAGSLSLAVSLPTMLVAFARYSRDSSFVILRRQARFTVVMALGSVVGVLIGGLLLGVVPDLVLVPILAALLVLSAFKIWKHDQDDDLTLGVGGGPSGRSRRGRARRPPRR